MDESSIERLVEIAGGDPDVLETASASTRAVDIGDEVMRREASRLLADAAACLRV